MCEYCKPLHLRLPNMGFPHCNFGQQTFPQAKDGAASIHDILGMTEDTEDKDRRSVVTLDTIKLPPSLQKPNWMGRVEIVLDG